MDTIALELRTTGKGSSLRIQFEEYANVGKFEFGDTILNRIDTLIFERSPKSQGTEFVNVQNTLLDIKAYAGTLVLRGLAFKLSTSGSILLSGYDFNRVNSHLILDSCSIFGETVSSAFLSWWGGPGSTVQIKRSFLVFQQGMSATSTSHKLLFNASNYSFMNNLFNFPGSMSATVLSGGKFEMFNNSFNRTQINLTSAQYQKASYDFRHNYIGYPPEVDAHENSNLKSFLKATDFDTMNCIVRNTVLYKTWSAFDHAANRPREFERDTTSNKKRESTAGIPSTEYWNWYAPGADSNLGMGSGDGARSPRYNVFPKKDSTKGTLFEGNEVVVAFKAGEFPRTFELSRVPVAVPDTFGPALRILSQEGGAMKFGPFEVSGIRLTTESDLGRPVLVAVDTSNRLVPQPVGAATTPFQFANGLSTARSFYFAFEGNTRRGDNVIPALPTNQLGANDSLVFSRVTASGMTTVADTVRAYPEFYRSLNRSLRIRTSASVTGTVLVGSRSAVAPWDSGEVYWWGATGSELHKPTKAANGKLLVRLPVADTVVVSLIEKLNVRKGSTIFPLANNGRIVVRSDSGFQLRIDSLSLAPDTALYGQATPAYGVYFPGRGPSDSITLYLPAGPDVGLFRTKAKDSVAIVPVTDTDQEAGLFKVHVAPGDSGLKLFSAIPYNVKAGIPFSGALPGLQVDSLRSETSGLFSSGVLDSSLWDRGKSDGVLPQSAVLLGGRSFRMLNLKRDSTVADGFSVRFEYDVPVDSTQVAAFARERDGGRWRPLVITPGDSARKNSISGLRIGDSAVIVLEVLRPAIDYLDTTKRRTGEGITVTAKYREGVTNVRYKQYMVELQSIGTSGEVLGDWKVGPEPIGESLFVSLAGFNGMLKYRVLFYHESGIATPDAPFETPVSLWKPSSLVVDSADKDPFRFNLVGFPYNGTLGATLDSAGLLDAEHKDVRRFFLLRSADTNSRKAVWDSGTVTAKTYKAHGIKAGDGLLFASSFKYRYKVDDNAQYLSPQPEVINPGGAAGWRFVAVPFPMDFAIAKVKSSKGTPGPFLKLEMRTEPDGTGSRRDYSWPLLGDSAKLRPYKAYAYYFDSTESLTFDPWYVPASRSPKASAMPAISSVDVTLEAGSLPRSMRLVSGPGARDVPFLPGPSGGLEMRVGGDDGYTWKREDNLSAIDLPVRFDAPQAVSARLAFARHGAISGSRWRAVLIDLASGTLIDPAAQSLSLPSGSSEYRLVAGSPAFVEERVSSFRAGLPADLALSQNAPNPFRGLTRIALDWPALAAGALASGAGRRAYLEVFDARGKRMQKLDLGRAQAGRQWVTLDASRWEPGIYSYRLTVVTGAGTSRLQKRMLVIR